MKLDYHSRPLQSDELCILKNLKNKAEKNKGGNIKYFHFLIAAFLGIGFAYIASIIPDSIWTLLLGTAAVFSVAFIVFTPYELYKFKKQQSAF
ncbi:hypothetical protein [uncultured Polaribacter sp.]|uniref:hypothetical protein n=1 Tax=uncultured Polaribacter sp. TaxID=174711 RepID=UPI0030D8B836